MSESKKEPAVSMVYFWVAIAVLLVAGSFIVTPELPENPGELAATTAIFYDAAAADATKLHQLINNDGFELLPPASAVGPAGDPSREKVKLFSKEVAEVEASLISHFANRQPETNDEIEKRLQSNFSNWQAAAKQHQAMVDAVLAIGALKKEDVKEGDPHPLADFRYMQISGNYVSGLFALRQTLQDARMSKYMPN